MPVGRRIPCSIQFEEGLCGERGDDSRWHRDALYPQSICYLRRNCPLWAWQFEHLPRDLHASVEAQAIDAE